MSPEILKWIIFNGFVLVMLALDLGVFHRKAHIVKIKEALIWSVIWIGLALAYNAVVYFWRGPTVALEFFTGYLIEKTLSVDNIFVFVLVFSFFKVPEEYQHRVLFWGILGALILRGIFIAAGAALIAQFHWIVYVFGGFLIFTGLRMALQKEHGVHPENNPLVRLFRRFFSVASEYHGQRLFVRLNSRTVATPLFIVLLVVEFTDLIFAVDSIPAIFAVTKDPFIVYTSNVFAILGLRALYFALAGVVGKFHYLKLGLSVVLMFVGIKMVLSETVFKIPISLSLVIITAVLSIAVAASLLWPKQQPTTPAKLRSTKSQ
jgi:tellurite resistance protein TerC